MASSSSSSLPLPSTHHQNQYTYEVFLSFRGDDTRYNFTDHLYKALCKRGIVTFRDDKLRRGEDISQELLKAIEESRVSIIVFSPNYASSRWCLDELVHILECRRSKGQEVRPIFYRVYSSDVRKQTGAFGDGFAKHDQCKYKDRICIWRKALEEAADLSGWPYKDGEYETEFIDRIIGELSTQVVNPSGKLDVAEHPVELESRREDVSRLLNLEENVNVRMVGIWGTGGIGKTTTAKEVFNSIRHMFDGNCFLADVRSNSNGLAKLQETLLSDVLGDSTLRVSSVDEGLGLIKTRMLRNKVLIILDDVSDYSSQLKKLVPSHNCFGQGSRILITTRDRGCLRDVDQVYEVKTLNDCQAMNLFSLNAFRTIRPPRDYLGLAERAIRYAQGLPLALIVLGSHLFRRSRDEWEATIGSCRGEPHTRIQDILRLSYDGLRDDNLKELFLDIACFFKGEYVERVKPILQACYDLNSGIEKLQEKALLRIDEDEIWMHDLIEEMGKKIANSEGEPGERTRLWNFNDVKDALTKNTETNKIKGIHLSSREQRDFFFERREQRDRICLNAKFFSKMENLKYFRLWGGDIKWSGNIEYLCFFWRKRNIDYLSNELRCLDWRECPLQSFPSNFHPKNLVKLNISHSRYITRLCDGCKDSPNLKYMDLSWCKSLRELPDLSGIPNLIELRLSGCKRLAAIPHSIGSLDKLEILNLQGCKGLQKFPRKASISPAKGSLFLPKLREFYLSRCNLSSADFIGDLDCLETLNKLNLSYNNFVTLPALGKFVNLSKINFSYCYSLREIPKLPPNIVLVDAEECESLERFSLLPKSLNTVWMDLKGCRRFSECLGNDMKMMENILVNNQDSRFSLVFPSLRCEVPKWFQYCSKEVTRTCSVSFEIPSKLELENISGVAICSVISNWADLRAVLSINGVHIHEWVAFVKRDHMWVGYIPLSGEIKGKLLGQWPYKCRVEFQGYDMKSCGVHLVCQPPNENSNKMVMVAEPAGESGMHTERKRPHTGANDDYHHQLEQQDQPLVMIPSK